MKKIKVSQQRGRTWPWQEEHGPQGHPVDWDTRQNELQETTRAHEQSRGELIELIQTLSKVLGNIKFNRKRSEFSNREINWDVVDSAIDSALQLVNDKIHYTFDDDMQGDGQEFLADQSSDQSSANNIIDTFEDNK